MEQSEAIEILRSSKGVYTGTTLFALGVIMEQDATILDVDPYVILPFLEGPGSWSSFAARCLYKITQRDGVTKQIAPNEWSQCLDDWTLYLSGRSCGGNDLWLDKVP